MDLIDTSCHIMDLIDTSCHIWPLQQNIILIPTHISVLGSKPHKGFWWSWNELGWLINKWLTNHWAKPCAWFSYSIDAFQTVYPWCYCWYQGRIPAGWSVTRTPKVLKVHVDVTWWSCFQSIPSCFIWIVSLTRITSTCDTVPFQNEDIKAWFPFGCEAVRDSLYVDDLGGGAESPNEIVNLWSELEASFEIASMQFHKWRSNKCIK